MAPPPRSQESTHPMASKVLELTNSDASKISYARFVKSTGTAGEATHAGENERALGVSIERTQPAGITEAAKGEFDGYETGEKTRVLIFSTRPVVVEAGPTLASIVEGDFITADPHGKAKAVDKTNDPDSDVPLLRATLPEFDQAGSTWVQGYLATMTGGDA